MIEKMVEEAKAREKEVEKERKADYHGEGDDDADNNESDAAANKKGDPSKGDETELGAAAGDSAQTYVWPRDFMLK
jgi:hypothetical protein